MIEIVIANSQIMRKSQKSSLRNNQGRSPHLDNKHSFSKGALPDTSVYQVQVGVLLKRLEKHSISWKSSEASFVQSHYRTKPRKLTASSLSPHNPFCSELQGLGDLISRQMRRNDVELNNFQNEHATSTMELHSLQRILKELVIKQKQKVRYSNRWVDKFRQMSREGAIIESPEIKSRKQTENMVSSVGNEGNSLLLSFKKNMEDDEDLMTLKYSQESNPVPPTQTRERLTDPVPKPFTLNTISEEQASQVKKSTNQHTRKPTNQVAVELQLTDECWGIVKTEVEKVSHEKGKRWKSRLHEWQQVFSQKEGGLERVIEQVAEQKVTADYEWKILIKSMEKECQQLEQLVDEEVQDTSKADERYLDMLQKIEAQAVSGVRQEQDQRVQSQRLMIQLMLQTLSLMT